MKYRADIDGLRSIAVLSVIFYHFGIANISGGFVGVDVFFVLSGYLIGNIIFRQLEKEKFSFGNFYFRRIRRLFPIYLLVIVSTFIVAYSLMLPKDFREFGQSIFSSTIYISNILFYLEAGYFDAASHVKPLLHTWSLSIEEQFYLIFPLLAWFSRSLSRKWIFILFISLTILSFLSAILYIDIDETAVFYLYPFRAWELFLGVILAIQLIPHIHSKITGNIYAFIGILMIIIPCFLYDKTTEFPGYTALIPCFGTALVLYSGEKNTFFIHRILSHYIPVFIGKISYSLYLWHWPIYILFIYDKQEELSLVDSMFLLAITFIVSILTWKYVETPFREGRIKFTNSKISVFTTTAIASSITLLMGYYIHYTDGMPSRLSPDETNFASVKLYGNLQNCQDHNNSLFPGIRHCTLGKPKSAEKYTLLWGDSHGGAFTLSFKEAIKGLDNNVLIAWSGGCPTLFDISKEETASTNLEDKMCTDQNQAIKELIERDHDKINAVVLIGRWSYYTNGSGFGIDEDNKISVWPVNLSKREINNQATLFAKLFESTLLKLKQSGMKTFVLEQVPEFSQFKSRIMAINLMANQTNINEITNKYAVEKYDNVLARQNTMLNLLQKSEKDGISTTLYTHKYFCDDSKCSAMKDGIPVYVDNNHVSTYGAKQIVNVFDPVVEYLKMINK